jgi:hypothetical protein
MEMLLSEPAAGAPRPDPVLPELPAQPAAADPFAALERDLRAFDAPKPSVPDTPPPAAPAVDRDLMVLDELERWLLELRADRAGPDTPDR